MDFVAICLAILLWLIRPQDWVPGMEGVGIMTYVMILGMIGVAMRPGGVNLKQLVQSPGDWMVVGYLGWIVWTSGDWFATAKELVPYAGFYFVTALSLNSWKRMERFLSCWVAGLAVVVVLALSTVYGYELAEGSQSITDGFNGRLALNTWIFNNPNSLGHGIAVLLGLGYIWWFWHRSIGLRVLALLAMAGAAQVVVETESKGSYLSGAAVVTVSLLFKRSRLTQVIVVGLMMTAGLGALKMLPRMETMDSREGGIAGRLVIWQLAYNAMETTVTGEGWKEFEAWFETEDYGLIRKATHGSYVNVGADLGYMGLFLFLGVLYANARTIWLARLPHPDMRVERIQRALLCLLVSFVASAWMIDRAYHTDYFILAGACAAMHRLLLFGETLEEEEGLAAGLGRAQGLPWSGGLRPAHVHGPSGSLALESKGTYRLAKASLQDRHVHLAAPGGGKDYSSDEVEQEPDRPFIRWVKLRWFDLLLCYGVLQLTLYVWRKVMTDFISF